MWSPRERGWSGPCHDPPPLPGVVPARAGVVRSYGPAVPTPRCGPRASGGGPPGIDTKSPHALWSPRERGWSGRVPQVRLVALVVPARAGVVRRRPGPGSRPRRGPRASGGGPVPPVGAPVTVRWSPRERGWSGRHEHHNHAPPVVPARAGVVRLPGWDRPGDRRSVVPARAGWSSVVCNRSASPVVVPARAGVARGCCGLMSA